MRYILNHQRWPTRRKVC